MSRKRIDLKLFKRSLQQIDVAAETIHVPGSIGESELEQAYYMAAAVLTTFDPWQLRPFGSVKTENGAVIDRLLANCTLRNDPQGRPRWSLNLTARKRALARLGTRQRLLAALETADDRPADRLQVLFEAYLRGTAAPVTRQSLTELRLTLQVTDWLSDTELRAELPEATELQARIAWEELMQPFRYLVAEGFHGRQQILEQLSTHVAAANSPLPILIFGPGGVGKSTLLAEFILRQTDRKEAEDRRLVSYIDFDQVFIDPQEPLTILMTAARQMAVQFPALAAPCGEFIQEWSYRLAADAVRGDQNIIFEQKAAYSEPLLVVPGSRVTKSQPRRQFEKLGWYVEEFHQLLNQPVLAGRRWLLVLDTFEEVQLRSRDAVRALDNFLHELREQIDTVRVIIAGRGDAQELAHTPQELAGFDEESAMAFLAQRGVTNRDIARQVFLAVTGNPLSLKLAARVIEQENLSNDVDQTRLQNVLRKVAESNIQGQLYQRILAHVENPTVRKLAHPGLILRYITPDLIERVLAEPCKAPIREGSDDAQRLFDLLSNEVSLVTPVGANILRHRPDVRAVMIAGLHSDRPLVVQAIHVAAIAYYEQRDSAEDRAEEIYHRLFVEQELADIDARWDFRFHDTLDRLLRPALYELTPRARAWLAAKLGLTGIEDVNWDESGLAEWEQYTEKRVRDLIQSNDWLGALTLLAQRPERSIGSGLYFLETAILRQQERWEEARRCAYDGLYSLKLAGDSVRLLDLLRQVIAIDLHLGHLAQAEEELIEARQLLQEQTYPDEIVRLELDLFELKIAARQNRPDAEAMGRLQEAIGERFMSLSDSELLSQPQLIQDVLLELGDTDSHILQKGLRLMTFGQLTPRSRETLAQALESWDLALSDTLNEPPGFLLRTINPSLPFQDGWQIYFQETRAAQITRDIEKLLAKYADLTILHLALSEEDSPGSQMPAKIGKMPVNGINFVASSVVNAIIDDF